MRIELIQATENAGKLITTIASICYGREEAKNPDKLLRLLFESGHHSTFEHVYYTWKIEGISRACLAQLTRHRHCSYTVESQRYTNQSRQHYIIPGEIFKVPELKEKYSDLMELCNEFYKELIELGYKKEDARFILPQSIGTNLFMSCNLRELIHINNLRIEKAAQWEIRNLVKKMVKLVVEHSPELEFMFRT